MDWISVDPLKNSTFDTEPPASDAVADIAIDAGDA